jgi:Mlc titration factor MtfA (ptsG expression regulator)
VLTLLIVMGLTASYVGWVIAEPWFIARRRARWRALPFPAEWRTILRRRVPFVRGLPADLQLQLKQHMQVFLREKAFIGCRGLEITDEVRVTIAAQACLLLLNRPTGYYPKLRQILVYPGAFLVDRVHADGSGVQQDQRQVLAGESWSQGQVILSWDDTLSGAAVANDGQNVVIHEFAHQLDQESGHANGAPPLAPTQRRAHWARVMGAAYDQLVHQAAVGEPSLMSTYGATNPAEFFAVASEVFFEQPGPLAAEQPALYQELAALYRVDPLSW